MWSQSMKMALNEDYQYDSYKTSFCFIVSSKYKFSAAAIMVRLEGSFISVGTTTTSLHLQETAPKLPKHWQSDLRDRARMMPSLRQIAHMYEI